MKLLSITFEFMISLNIFIYKLKAKLFGFLALIDIHKRFTDSTMSIDGKWLDLF